MKNLSLNPIGKVNINENGMFIELNKKYTKALKGLDGFSHINVIWWFSDSDTEKGRNTLEVSKPYNTSPDVMGTFATRSESRPNPIALTASQVINIDYENGIIQLAYIDANNNTPVLDIKPYSPAFDKIENPKLPNWCSHWPKSSEESATFNWANEFNF